MSDTETVIEQLRIAKIKKLKTHIAILLVENNVPAPRYEVLAEKIMKEILGSGVVDECYQRTWEDMNA